MAAEYSYIPVQTVATDGTVLFNNGSRTCRKGCILHRDSSGLFFLRGASSQSRAVYKVQFDGNIAIATGGTVEPISVALALNGEQLTNALATVTPAAIGDFFNVSVATFIDVPCNCCVTVSVENASATTAIDVTNANIIIERVA
jgi:hypothetical protein